MSHQNHLQDQKAEYFCSAAKCRFVGFKSHLSPFVTLFPSPHFHPCTPQGSLGCPLLLWPLPLQHKTPQAAWAGKVGDKNQICPYLKPYSPYQERDWMWWFENPRKISRIKEFPLHWMGAFPILNCSFQAESPAEWDMSRGHPIISELPAQFLKHLCRSSFDPMHGVIFVEGTIRPTFYQTKNFHSFNLQIFRNIASWQAIKSSLGSQISTFPSSTWCRESSCSQQQSPTQHSCQQSYAIIKL